MKRLLPLLIIILAGCTKPSLPEPVIPPPYPKVSAVQLLRAQHPQELTRWQKLQMAIIWTESKANPKAIGRDNDGGLYQMVPVYVEEVNRVCGTHYTHDDVFDPDKAIEIFNAMQGYYNPNKDFDTAFRYHNRSEAYKRVVMQNYELICRMEEVRAKLIEKCPVQKPRPQF